ncbi:DUF4198 domain-containing protein [Photobacterium angustum]|uniref:DUF4198 domain-containing protein n=1 Tax=Photobacterium angustum TaxID=661 RepID=A0ABX5H8C6_PHOAN|nr:DUF4198 domain-containing protein [Photobacterium angustum]PSX12353.1 DUF4198 domain-containing protein [Photobacterium angustum]
MKLEKLKLIIKLSKLIMKKNKLKVLFLTCLMTTSFITAFSTEAHPRWILPSHFTVSKQGGDWISFDVSASHSTFNFDKAPDSETARVMMPDGRELEPNNVTRGQRRSIFDFYFSEEGTHKVHVNQHPKYYTRYQAGHRDTLKTVEANKANRNQLLPDRARNVYTEVNYTRAESYITVGKPSTKVMEISGEYLEMVPLTHPADIVEGQPVTLQFFFYGKPQAGVKIDITREGTMYRNRQEQINLVSDKDGKITFTPYIAGRYLLKSNYIGNINNNSMYDKANVSVHFTFEVLLK